MVNRAIGKPGLSASPVFPFAYIKVKQENRTWGLCSSSVLVNTVATKLWEQVSLREMYYKPKYIVG